MSIKLHKFTTVYEIECHHKNIQCIMTSLYHTGYKRGEETNYFCKKINYKNTQIINYKNVKKITKHKNTIHTYFHSSIKNTLKIKNNTYTIIYILIHCYTF